MEQVLIQGEDYELSVKENNGEYFLIMGGYYFGEKKKITKELYETLINELKG